MATTDASVSRTYMPVSVGMPSTGASHSSRFENIKRELCEAPVLGMPTEKGMYVLDTDASVVAISAILHQEQEWMGEPFFVPLHMAVRC